MAEKQKEKKSDDLGHPEVHVKYLNTNEVAKFNASWGTTVSEVWEKAYGELGESRKDVDTFETEDGTDLGPYLGYTLERLREEKVAPNRHFAIRSETGGA